LPLAVLYRVFGVSALSTNLPAILAGLITLLVVYAAAPTPRAKVIGLGLGVACAPLLRHTNLLNIDLPCGALLAVATRCLHRHDRGAAWPALAMLAWFTAFLVKETALWLAPVWIWAFVVDARARGVRSALRDYAPALAIGLLLGVAYLATCAAVWGDAFARFRGVDELTDGHAWSMGEAPASEWFARLTWGPALLLVRQFQILLVPALAATWLVRGRERIWLVAAASIVGLFWFGSTSLSAYAPLPLLPRMVIAAAPPLLVIAAIAADRALDKIGPRMRKPLAIAFAAAALAPLVVAVAVAVGRGAPERSAYALVRAAHSPDHPVTVVCGDPRCEAAGRFQFEFAPPPGVAITFAPSFAAGPRPAGLHVFALVHRKRSPKAEWTSTVFEPRRIDLLGLPTLLVHRDLTLYDAGDGVRLWEALR
jgi:hypothetical protein